MVLRVQTRVTMKLCTRPPTHGTMERPVTDSRLIQTLGIRLHGSANIMNTLCGERNIVSRMFGHALLDPDHCHSEIQGTTLVYMIRRRTFICFVRTAEMSSIVVNILPQALMTPRSFGVLTD